MTQPLIVTQLLLKRAEIETQIKSLEDRLGHARADLLHVAATVRLFDPTAIDRPATVYHGATKGMRRSDLCALCRAALEASPEPLDTRQLTRHVITAEGWDMGDARLRLAITHKVGLMMKCFEHRGVVRTIGTRERATLRRLI